MFVGFIAVVVILLVIVGLMTSGVLSGSDNSKYMTEAKKVHSMFSHLQGEANFYYAANSESYLGIDMNYYLKHKFAGSQMIPTSNMAQADWEGWPTNVDGGFPATYTGPYISVGGTAGDEIRLIVTSTNNGKSAAFHVLKKKVNVIPESYLKVLEKTLAGDPNYIGG